MPSPHFIPNSEQQFKMNNIHRIQGSNQQQQFDPNQGNYQLNFLNSPTVPPSKLPKLQKRQRTKRIRKSRLILQWKRKRALVIKLKRLKQPFLEIKQFQRALYHHEVTRNTSNTKRLFGFAANPNLSPFSNTLLHFSNMTMYKYNNCLHSHHFHNLCAQGTYLKPGIGTLLGKGLKFCI